MLIASFFVRITGNEAERREQAKQAFGALEVISLDGLDEFAVLTEKMTEVDFEKKVAQSFVYHPLVLYAAVIVTAEAVSALAAKVTGKPKYYLGHENLFVYIAVGIVLVNWIVKNVLLVGFGIDLLAVPLG